MKCEKEGVRALAVLPKEDDRLREERGCALERASSGGGGIDTSEMGACGLSRSY